MAHFADFDGAKIDSWNNLLQGDSPLNTMNDMDGSESDWEGLLLNWLYLQLPVWFYWRRSLLHAGQISQVSA